MLPLWDLHWGLPNKYYLIEKKSFILMQNVFSCGKCGSGAVREKDLDFPEYNRKLFGTDHRGQELGYYRRIEKGAVWIRRC